MNRQIEAWLMDPAVDPARDMLAKGLPIVYTERDTPKGLVVREYPDGHRELVDFDEAGRPIIDRAL